MGGLAYKIKIESFILSYCALIQPEINFHALSKSLDTLECNRLFF